MPIWTVVISLWALALGIAIGRYWREDTLHDLRLDAVVYKARCERARKALDVYGEHSTWCAENYEDGPCNCGLAAAFRGTT